MNVSDSAVAWRTTDGSIILSCVTDSNVLRGIAELTEEQARGLIRDLEDCLTVPLDRDWEHSDMATSLTCRRLPSGDVALAVRRLGDQGEGLSTLLTGEEAGALARALVRW